MRLIPRAVAERRDADQKRMRTETSVRSQGDRWLNNFWRLADENMTYATATPTERDNIKATVERVFWGSLTPRWSRENWDKATRQATDRFNAVLLSLARTRLQSTGLIQPTVSVVEQPETFDPDAFAEAMAAAMRPDESSDEYWQAYYEALGAYDGV